MRARVNTAWEHPMVAYVATRTPDRCPMHPGALLRDFVLRGVDLSKLEIAEALGVSRAHLDSILKEKAAVSPTIAARLGNLFGNGPDLWIGMQASYDTWQAVHRVNTDDIKTVRPGQPQT